MPAARDEPAVERERDHPGDHERERERAPDSRSPTPASMAPGMTSMIALSTISINAMLNVSVASAIGTTADRASPALSSGRLVSE